MQYSLGVDLGTTWTAAVIDDGEEPRPLMLGDQGPAIASVIARDGDGFVFGSKAERQILAAPASGVREVKRRVGDSAPIIVAGTPYSADALLGAMLAHVVEVATQEMQGPPDRVVLTHPAAWGEFKLDVLRAAALAAGLAEVELLPEPTAAAMHYATLGKLEPGEVVAVYDFGGGTFDAAVIRRGDDGFEVLGTPEGIERLGGIDLDQAVLAHVDAAVDGKLRELDRENPEVRQSLARLRDECVRAKEALSADTETTIPVDVPGLQTTVRLTRAEFEAMVRPRLDETMVALERSVSSAGLSYEDLASVLLVGGSSRIPVVGEVLGATTGRPTAIDAHPKLVVASGAAARIARPAFDDAPEPASDEDDEDASDEDEATGEAAGASRTGRGAKKGKGDGAGEGGAAGKSARRGPRLGGAGVAAAVAGVAGVVAAADSVFGSDSAGAATGQQHHAANVAAEQHKDEAQTVPARERERGGAGPAREHEQAAAGQAREQGRPGAGTAREREQARAGEAHRGGVAAEHAAMAASARAHLMGNDGGRAEHRESGGGVAAPRVREEMRAEPARHEAAAPHVAAAPPAPDQFDQYRDQMMERLASWTGPPGASPEEVAHLRQELVGVVHRAEHIPGQSIENAQAELEDRLDDKLHSFQQDQEIGQQEQQIGALVQQEQRENEQHIREVGFSAEFGQYQSYVAQGMQNWKPEGWGDGGPNNGAALAEFQAQVSAVLESTHYDPNKPYAVQEQALHDTVAGLAQTFQNEQYVEYQKDQSAELDKEFTATQDLPIWDQEDAQDSITDAKTQLATQVANVLGSTSFDKSFLPSPTESPDDALRRELHVFDNAPPPPPTPEELAAEQQAAEHPTGDQPPGDQMQAGDQLPADEQMQAGDRPTGDQATGDQPAGDRPTTAEQEQLQASGERIAERSDPHIDPASGIDPAHVETLGMTDAFDHVAGGTNGEITDPLHHDPLGAMGTSNAQQPAAADGQAGADGVHTLTPGAVHDDFLGTAAATEHLTSVAATAMADASAMAHTAMPTDAMNPSAPADPDPAPAGGHDISFGTPDHDASGNGADPADPTHHDPGVFDEHHPGDPDAHHAAGMGDPTMHHDATDPFAHSDTASPEHHDDPVMVMHDEPAPVEPNPDDDMP